MKLFNRTIGSPLIRSCVVVLGLGSAALAEPPPAFQITTAAATEKTGPVVAIKGRIGSTYNAFPVVADDTTFDLTEALWMSPATHPTATMFVAGNQPTPPHNLRMVGGVFHGNIPLDWSWSITHAFGGSAFLTIATGLQSIEDARIHNVQDGWRPRETPEFLPRAYPNTGRFLMRGCYVTGIRDDCIENDEFLPGAVEDCLFDGVFTFFSEQNEQINGTRFLDVPTIGADEDAKIEITRSLVRLAVTSGGEVGPGTWFKLHGYDSPNHQIVMKDCIFAVDQMPRKGWKHLGFPKTASFTGTNLFLWLGEPGICKTKLPDGITFLEGPAAKEKRSEARNVWLVAHGYEPRPPNDLDPMQAPVAAPTRK